MVESVSSNDVENFLRKVTDELCMVSIHMPSIRRYSEKNPLLPSYSDAQGNPVFSYGSAKQPGPGSLSSGQQIVVTYADRCQSIVKAWVSPDVTKPSQRPIANLAMALEQVPSLRTSFSTPALLTLARVSRKVSLSVDEDWLWREAIASDNRPSNRFTAPGVDLIVDRDVASGSAKTTDSILVSNDLVPPDWERFRSGWKIQGNFYKTFLHGQFEFMRQHARYDTTYKAIAYRCLGEYRWLVGDAQSSSAPKDDQSPYEQALSAYFQQTVMGWKPDALNAYRQEALALGELIKHQRVLTEIQQVIPLLRAFAMVESLAYFGSVASFAGLSSAMIWVPLLCVPYVPGQPMPHEDLVIKAIIGLGVGFGVSVFLTIFLRCYYEPSERLRNLPEFGDQLQQNVTNAQHRIVVANDVRKQTMRDFFKDHPPQQ